MKKYSLLYVMMLVVALVSLSSCSETNDDSEEYVNWRSTNETYFNELYTTTQQKISSGDTSWKIIRKWSLPDDNADFTAKPTDFIIVHVLSKGTSTSGSPMYTDSVRVNYRGHLLPSTSYPTGYVFDSSYTGNYDPATANPRQFAVSAVVDGFSTALQNMIIGDRWEVYMPYQLGYGTSASSSIPAYSTLVFDLSLMAFSRTGAVVTRAKANNWIIK